MWVGWVTPDYHQHDMNFDLTKVRAVTVTMGDEQGNIHSRYGEGWALAPPPFSSLPAYLPSMAPSLCLASSSVFFLFLFLFLFLYLRPVQVPLGRHQTCFATVTMPGS